MAPARIASLHLGQPREYTDAAGAVWRTAIAKEAVAGPVRVSHLGPVGDAVADTRHHGGLHQAVMVYSRAHHPYWKERLNLAIDPGGLGENFSVEGLDDEGVCIGDLFQVGAVRLQVAQPRQPCGTLSRYWHCPELLPAIWETARSGWYFRVLEEGDVRPGEALRLLDRPHPGWSSARVLRAFRDADRHPTEALAASELRHLTPAWQAKLREKAGR
jgi:MOSC domain-containing protein YiiM